MDEIWKDVDGYEGIYQVSNMGRVRSLDRVIRIKEGNKLYERVERGKIMSQKIQNTGRLQVALRKTIDGKNERTTLYVHRLVAFAFVPGYFEGATVNHKDENPLNNKAENLEWMTKAENNVYGTHCERAGKALRMSVEQLTVDGKHIAYFDSMTEASKSTGTNIGSMHNCLYGRTATANGYVWKFTTDFRKLLRQRKV